MNWIVFVSWNRLVDRFLHCAPCCSYVLRRRYKRGGKRKRIVLQLCTSTAAIRRLPLVWQWPMTKTENESGGSLLSSLVLTVGPCPGSSGKGGYFSYDIFIFVQSSKWINEITASQLFDINLMDSDFVHSFEDGTKMKTLSDI